MINKFELRTLKEKDALLMYEWMHDQNVVENLKTDFFFICLPREIPPFPFGKRGRFVLF